MKAIKIVNYVVTCDGYTYSELGKEWGVFSPVKFVFEYDENTTIR